jgi:uncharacterized protein (TIGR02246 family)
VASATITRWLTLGANIGVLIGIVLVLVELDQNRDMMRAQTRNELAMGIVDLLQTPASNAQLADVLYRAHAGADLTPVESFQFEMRSNALFRYWENVHYQYRVGLYDDVEFARQREAWGASMRNSRLAQEYWCRVRLYYSPEFMAELDSLVPGKCTKEPVSMDKETVIELAKKYTAAWNSQTPANVASFFAEGATLYVNGAAATGRDAITEVAHGFMTAFPDMVLLMDKLDVQADKTIYHWTFIGTNSGPDGTGNKVHFSGFEEWTISEDGLISQSDGNFDNDEYQHQLAHGID